VLVRPSVYDCNVCFVKSCRSNAKLFWLISMSRQCLKSRSFSLCLSLVSSRPNPKYLGSSRVSIPLSWPLSLSQKKNVLYTASQILYLCLWLCPCLTLSSVTRMYTGMQVGTFGFAAARDDGYGGSGGAGDIRNSKRVNYAHLAPVAHHHHQHANAQFSCKAGMPFTPPNQQCQSSDVSTNQN